VGHARPAELRPSARLARAKGQLREGLGYVRSRPPLLVPIVLVGVVGTFGLNFQITLALVVKQEFGRGAGTYAFLSSMLALGSLLGALASARRSGPPRQRTLFASVLVFGLLTVGVGLAPSLPVTALLLVPTGVAVLTFSTTANSLLQLATAEQMRGRVMALYILVFLGGTPAGAPIIGALSDVLGPRSGLLIGGGVTAVAAIAAALWMTRARGLRLEPHVLRRRPHIHVRPLEGEHAAVATVSAADR
jgi:MFS family permease